MRVVAHRNRQVGREMPHLAGNVGGQGVAGGVHEHDLGDLGNEMPGVHLARGLRRFRPKLLDQHFLLRHAHAEGV